MSIYTPPPNRPGESWHYPKPVDHIRSGERLLLRGESFCVDDMVWSESSRLFRRTRRRKSYDWKETYTTPRPLPPWVLPRHLPGFRPLRDDERWHRLDWKPEWLPEGWRPLLRREREQSNDQHVWEKNDGSVQSEWNHAIHPQGEFGHANNMWTHHRTTRPLPGLKKRVPLEASDIPPGSVIKHPGQHGGWISVTGISEECVYLGDATTIDYKYFMNLCQIKRPTDTEWQPCWKEIEE